MQYNEHIKINNEYVCIMVYIYRIIFKQRVLFFIYIYTLFILFILLLVVVYVLLVFISLI